MECPSKEGPAWPQVILDDSQKTSGPLRSVDRDQLFAASLAAIEGAFHVLLIILNLIISVLLFRFIV